MVTLHEAGQNKSTIIQSHFTTFNETWCDGFYFQFIEIHRFSQLIFFLILLCQNFILAKWVIENVGNCLLRLESCPCFLFPLEYVSIAIINHDSERDSLTLRVWINMDCRDEDIIEKRWIAKQEYLLHSYLTHPESLHVRNISGTILTYISFIFSRAAEPRWIL